MVVFFATVTVINSLRHGQLAHSIWVTSVCPSIRLSNAWILTKHVTWLRLLPSVGCKMNISCVLSDINERWWWVCVCWLKVCHMTWPGGRRPPNSTPTFHISNEPWTLTVTVALAMMTEPYVLVVELDMILLKYPYNLICGDLLFQYTNISRYDFIISN